MPELEVIALSLEDAIAAENGGASSVEIIANLAVGGLTPDLDLVRQIVARVHIETHVIVRPHADSFVYDAGDKEAMHNIVRELSKLPISSVVIGGMTADGNFDFDLLHAVMNEIEAERITIHRVIDHVNAPYAALQKLSQMIGYVLCSGAITNAYDGRHKMAQWVKSLGADLYFKCGGGITLENVMAIQQVVNAPTIHSGRAVRSLGGVDSEKVAQLVALLDENQKDDP
ncbi:MAG: copper homeostasis protein CutC [Anaerolineae bacterium]|nr:copper homeostasis protein CutC [Anaerolineae bacterium]MDQ7034113.1 copper homeostasis protein CutC [Anaerolineae bacterium]